MIRLLAVFIAGSLVAAGQDFETNFLPSEIPTHLRTEIRINTKAEMSWGKLPDHPKIVWLDVSSVRTNYSRTINKLGFVATSPGVIEIPPIPIVLEGKEFFIRMDPTRATENDFPEDYGSVRILWNGSEIAPKEVHLGESLDIDFIEEFPLRQSDPSHFYSMLPSSRVSKSQWHQFRKIPGRKPHPADYFFISRGIFGNGLPFSSETYRENSQTFQRKTYRSRLYFTKQGRAVGHLGSTVGPHPAYARTYLIPVDIEVLPLPDLPNNQAINTGLIGNWDFEHTLSSRSLQENEPFTVKIRARGKGNPKLINPINLSREGFPTVNKSDGFVSRLDGNYRDEWRGEFTQTLIPTGKVGTFPATSLASFDTKSDTWKLTEVVPTLTLPGVTDAVAELRPRSELGKAITLPVLLNLPALTFGALALGPFLPFFFGLAKKKLDARDPEKSENDRKLKELVSAFASPTAEHALIDDELLPLLRSRLKLPTGATGSEVADALPKEDRELAEMIRDHASSAFTPRANTLDLTLISARLAKLSFLFLLTCLNLRAGTLSEANKAFETSRFNEAITAYQALIEENPGHPSLHFNLAQAYLSADDTGRARAACHTALLLDPLDSQMRTLMDEIRNRQGQPALPGTALIALRPDQWILLGTAFWILSFAYLGMRHFRKLPKWPAFLIITLVIGFVGTAAWRQKHAYSENQYMVLINDLPREPEAGIPDWDYSAFRAGQIVKVAETTETHAMISSTKTSFWLPLEHLQKVW